LDSQAEGHLFDMEAPASYSGIRCSWCGTLNAPDVTVCSKCGAVLSSAHHIVTSGSVGSSSGTGTHVEPLLSSEQERINAQVDSTSFDKISSEAMRALGLGPTFISSQSIAFFVAGCLSLYILISLGGAVVDISQVLVLSKQAPGSRTPPAGITEGQILTLLIRFLLIGVVLLTAVFFLMWIHRAHKNLTALGAAELKYSPGWAVGSFFIPVLNLFRPYQVVTEIWKASASRARRRGGINWTNEQTPVFLNLWWALWLISGFLDSLSTFLVFGTGQGQQQLIASRYRLVYDVVSISCAALAITVVLRITARQEAANLANSPPPALAQSEW